MSVLYNPCYIKISYWSDKYWNKYWPNGQALIFNPPLSCSHGHNVRLARSKLQILLYIISNVLILCNTRTAVWRSRVLAVAKSIMQEITYGRNVIAVEMRKLKAVSIQHVHNVIGLPVVVAYGIKVLVMSVVQSFSIRHIGEAILDESGSEILDESGESILDEGPGLPLIWLHMTMRIKKSSHKFYTGLVIPIYNLGVRLISASHDIYSQIVYPSLNRVMIVIGGIHTQVSQKAQRIMNLGVRVISGIHKTVAVTPDIIMGAMYLLIMKSAAHIQNNQLIRLAYEILTYPISAIHQQYVLLSEPIYNLGIRVLSAIQKQYVSRVFPIYNMGIRIKSAIQKLTNTRILPIAQYFLLAMKTVIHRAHVQNARMLGELVAFSKAVSHDINSGLIIPVRNMLITGKSTVADIVGNCKLIFSIAFMKVKSAKQSVFSMRIPGLGQIILYLKSAMQNQYSQMKANNIVRYIKTRAKRVKHINFTGLIDIITVYGVLLGIKKTMHKHYVSLSALDARIRLRAMRTTHNFNTTYTRLLGQLKAIARNSVHNVYSSLIDVVVGGFIYIAIKTFNAISYSYNFVTKIRHHYFSSKKGGHYFDGKN